MMTLTALELLEVENAAFDCAPVLEGLIYQTYIYDLFIHSNQTHIIFHAAIMKPVESETTGWIEDNEVHKGETLHQFASFDYAETAAWLRAKTDELLIELTGSLEATSFSV